MTASKASSRSSSTTLPTVRAVNHCRKKLKVQASAPASRMARITQAVRANSSPLRSPAMASIPRPISTGRAAFMAASRTIITATKAITGQCARK